MGLLSLSGKASAVLGPSLYGFVADGFAPSLGKDDAQRAAICAVGTFFVLALVVLRFVDEKKGIAQAQAASEPEATERTA
jgi:MFS-type transporter involved in bile tolerance (Atg22 family)